MDNEQGENEETATPEQFTALLLRFLARRAEQAQRRRRADQEGAVSSPPANPADGEREQDAADDDDDEDEEDDEEDASHSPDTENEAWFFQSARRKKKSVPKLDLIDDTEEDIEKADEHRNRAIGRLKQWIDDGQIRNLRQIEQYFEHHTHDDDEKKEAKEQAEHEQHEQKQPQRKLLSFTRNKRKNGNNHHHHNHSNSNSNSNGNAKKNKRALVCNDIQYGSAHEYIPYNFQHFMQLREIGKCKMYSNRKGVLGRCSDYLFANNVIEKFQGNSRVFCSDFSCDGNVLCVASQDHVIHLIDSRSGVNCEKWPIYKQVESQFSGWSIIDVALSPDHEFVAYSGWSSSIYLVNTYGSHELHEAHDLNISTFNSWGRCCVFGVEFDPNSKKVICALSGGCLILHDLERKVNEFSDPSAHEDDINQATFLDTNIIISGSDDALLRVWDARQKSKCVGGFVGHYQGITCVSTPNDHGSSNYVLSNSKDQTMKLWDLRCMNTLNELTTTRAQLQPSTGSFDYRYRGWNPQSSTTYKKRFRIDKSLVTYKGHSVKRTLCRSGFSPTYSTNSKYVYCASADCTVYIYDTLTAKLHCTLSAHSDIVRDVCWHPYLPIIVSASWDGSVVRWSYKGSNKDGSIKRRSRRRRRRSGKPKQLGLQLNHKLNDEEDAQCHHDHKELSHDEEEDAFTDSGSDSEDNEVFELPAAVSLDMPEHLRKRNDYDYW